MDSLSKNYTAAPLSHAGLGTVADALSAAYPVLPTRPIYLTVEQFSERNPAFTPPALRNLIFKAAPRQSSRGEVPGNGLAEAGAILRLNRRVLIDEAKFLVWVARVGSAK
jgi:hypothetical protein